jgi:hypothetical protein
MCRVTQERKTIAAWTMFTKDILFGMNILSLAGFLVMGLSLTLRRMGNAGAPLSIGLMCAGTALVFFGLYAGGGQTSWGGSVGSSRSHTGHGTVSKFDHACPVPSPYVPRRALFQ